MAKMASWMQCSECIRWKQLCETTQTETKKVSIAHCTDHLVWTTAGLADSITRVPSPSHACNSCTVNVQGYQKHITVLAVIPLQTHQRSLFYKTHYTCYSFNNFTAFLIHKMCTVWVMVYIATVIRSKGVDKNHYCRWQWYAACMPQRSW